MSEDPLDDQLRARLRRADPAASLPPVARARVDRLLEDAMADDTTTDDSRIRSRGRGPWAWVAAAATVAVIGGVAALAMTGSEPEAEPAPPAAQPAPTATELTVPAGAPGRCMVPNPTTLATAAYAVDGVVTEVEGDVAILEVSEWFAGEPTDRVRVVRRDTGRATIVGAPELAVGERYLLAGTRDGDLMVCGFSAAWSEELAGIYAEAFA